MPYSTTAVKVQKNDTIRFKYTAPNDFDKADTVTIKIGQTNVTWTLRTIVADQSPDPFYFIDVNNAELNTLYTYADGSRTSEQTVTISGLSTGIEAPVYFTANIPNATVSDYALEINGNGTWFIPGTSTKVKNADVIKIRVKSSPLNGSSVSALLVIGNASARWGITTKLRLRTLPNPFPSFANLIRQPLNTYIYSNVVQILGLSSSPVSTQVFGTDSFVGISSTNTTTTDANGFNVLSGATFASNTGNISNGQYIQLKARSGTTVGDIKSFGFSVGEGSTSSGDGSEWQVTTLTQTPVISTNFSFINKTDQAINSLIESAPAPTAGISGLGPGVSVPVTLVSTTSSLVKIKINDGSIGIFPTSVQDGDRITLYAQSSSSILTNVEVIIKVSTVTIAAWTVITNAGADSQPDPLIKPTDLTGVVPATDQTSGAVSIGGINVPVNITATNGALISIDYDTPVAGPRQFTPGTNTSFRLVLRSSDLINTIKSTTVTVTGQTFTWNVTTYALIPVATTYKSTWYSKKNEIRSGNIASAKYDGYSIGTIIPVLKESASSYGTDLTGGRNSRFPGFIYCDGRTLNVADYLELFLAIGNTYGGTGNYTLGSATGGFKLPDYRNRRMCGTGVVDGNNSSSVYLGVTGGVGGSGTYNTVGQEGGWWYVDKVGTAGSPPEEQATGPATSDFFTLGTVKTTGADLVTDDGVEFNITSGAISATVGPISAVAVRPPEHDHYYIAAVTESDGDEPYLKWGETVEFFAFQAGETALPDGTVVPLYQYNTPSGFNAESDKIASSLITNVTNMRALFKTWLSNRGWGVGSNPDLNLEKQTGNFNSIQKIIDDLNSVGDKMYYYANYWPSPADQLPAGPLLRDTGYSNSNIGTKAAGVIDTVESSFNVSNFETVGGNSTATHSHYLSPIQITSAVNSFSYDGAISGGPGALRIGLPASPIATAASETLQITFNQSDVQMSFNEGTFKLNTTNKIPKPSYTIAPQSIVPVITQFHKVRYMIKAY